MKTYLKKAACFILIFSLTFPLFACFGPKPKSADFSSKPAKVLYTIGETLNIDGMYLNILYDDNTSKLVLPTSNMVKGFDSSKTNFKQTLTVEYTENKATVSASYDIQVFPAAPANFNYYIDEDYAFCYPSTMISTPNAEGVSAYYSLTAIMIFQKAANDGSVVYADLDTESAKEMMNEMLSEITNSFNVKSFVKSTFKGKDAAEIEMSFNTAELGAAMDFTGNILIVFTPDNIYLFTYFIVDSILVANDYNKIKDSIVFKD